jgi:hypothetical protein
MSTNNDTYLAVFLASKSGARVTAWNDLPEAERQARQDKGMKGWQAWVEKHQTDLVAMGGPLGKTKAVSDRGIEDIANLLCAYAVVRADSHKAAARMFEGHPHFTIFPGDSIEVMPVLPIPSQS